MNLDAALARITADNDRDIARLADWMREQDGAVVLKLWDMMNREYPNQWTEAMTQFAIVGFCVVADSKIRNDRDAEESPNDH